MRTCERILFRKKQIRRTEILSGDIQVKKYRLFINRYDNFLDVTVFELFCFCKFTVVMKYHIWLSVFNKKMEDISTFVVPLVPLSGTSGGIYPGLQS